MRRTINRCIETIVRVIRGGVALVVKVDVRDLLQGLRTRPLAAVESIRSFLRPGKGPKPGFSKSRFVPGWQGMAMCNAAATNATASRMAAMSYARHPHASLEHARVHLG